MSYDEQFVQEKIEAKLRKIAARRAGVKSSNDQRFFNAHKNDDYYKGVLDSVNSDLKLCGFSIAGSILDLGSGCGTFVKVCKDHNLEVAGVEPDREVIEVAKLKGVGGDIVKGVGEYLPFREESFDVITSMSVLEHVQSPQKVLCESIRVLKRKGFFWLSVPDYSRSFYEGHYDLFWLPLMPKKIAKIYVRLRGRTDAKFIDSIQYITRRDVVNALRNLNVRMIDMEDARIDYVCRRAQAQVRTDCLVKIQDHGKIQSRRWRNIVKSLKWIGFGEKALARLCELYCSMLISISIFILILKNELRLKKGNIVLVVQKF